jgi:hypothetical protein
MSNDEALRKLNVGFNRDIDAALDAYCAQLRWQDTHGDAPMMLITFAEIGPQAATAADLQEKTRK